MVKCVSGFMVPKKGTTRENIIKRFNDNAEKDGIKVLRVVHCLHIGDGAWRIVANIDTGE